MTTTTTTTRLDLIIKGARHLEQEASLAKAGLGYRRYDENGEVILPAGTFAHLEATRSLLTQLAELAS